MFREAIAFLRRWGLPLISVVGTGIVGAVCLAAMTAGRFDFVAPESAAKLAIFIVFQTLGVTVVKAGLDSYVFARASSDSNGVLYAVAPAFKKYVFPVWFLFFAVSYIALESTLVVSVCVVAVFFDVYSAVRVAEFTARKSYAVVAAANISKYPLYFVLLFALGRLGSVSYHELLYLYVLISFVRFSVVFCFSRVSVFAPIPAYSFGVLGVQQVFNYLLFKLDQVSIPVVRDVIPGLGDGGLSQFVFLLKFPELVSYCVTAVGAIFFPVLAKRWTALPERVTAERGAANLIMFLAGMLGLLIYLAVFGFGAIRLVVFFPLVLSACLCFEVNFMTYKLLSVGAFRPLLRGLGGAVGSGVAIVGGAALMQSVDIMYWVVPLQMFLCAMIIRSTRTE